MKKIGIAGLVLGGLAAWTSIGLADKGRDLAPAKPARVALAETFDGQQLGSHWKVNKGQWQPEAGALVGREQKEDQHAAVVTLARPFTNAAIRFSFQCDGATGFNLSFNHAKGHLFRILIAEDSLAILKDRDKKDAASRPATLARQKVSLPSGQWHTLLVEVHGDRVVVHTEQGVEVAAADPALAVEKTGYRFVTRAGPLRIDDVTVWQGE